MNRFACRCLCFSVVLAVTGAAHAAFAQAPDNRLDTRPDTRVADNGREPSEAKKRKAKRFVDAGLVHHEQGEYEEAIRWFRKAYELIPHPQLLYNIGLAHRMAGRRQSALD